MRLIFPIFCSTAEKNKNIAQKRCVRSYRRRYCVQFRENISAFEIFTQFRIQFVAIFCVFFCFAGKLQTQKQKTIEIKIKSIFVNGVFITFWALVLCGVPFLCVSCSLLSIINRRAVCMDIVRMIAITNNLWPDLTGTIQKRNRLGPLHSLANVYCLDWMCGV